MNTPRFTVTPQDKFGDTWEAKFHPEGDNRESIAIRLERGSKKECYDAIERIQRAETYEEKQNENL